MKGLLKRVARGAAWLAVLPIRVSFELRARILGRDRALHGSSQLLALVPGVVGTYLRAAFYGGALEAFDPSACVEFGTLLSKAAARIGARTYIGPGCHLGLVDIGEDVLLASGVQVPSGGRTHGIDALDVPIRDQEGELTRVRIGSGTWIGAGAIVMAHVGRACVVGAGAVVTREMPDAAVIAGVPARVVRSRVESGGLAS